MVHHSLVFLSEAFRASLVCRAVDTAWAGGADVGAAGVADAAHG